MIPGTSIGWILWMIVFIVIFAGIYWWSVNED